MTTGNSAGSGRGEELAARVVAGALSDERIRALDYHSRPGRGASCGSMAADIDLLFAGLVGFAGDGRLELTASGWAMHRTWKGLP